MGKITIEEVIAQIDSQKPNTCSIADKVRWLNDLDGKIKALVIDTHEDGTDIVFDGYSEENLQAELLVSSPFENIYILWLEAQIDYDNHEYAKYNNSISRYNEIYTAFENYYNRKHMPKQTKINYF